MATKYYSLKKILKYGALYNVIFGQRTNGKTFSVISLMLEEFCKHGNASAYIRRLDSELMNAEIHPLLTPQIDNIIKFSKGKYNNYIYKSRCFYLTHTDENGEIDEISQPFLYCLALSKSSKSKGADRGMIKYTLFDEFLTRSFYLANEFVLYCEVLATLIRDREGTVNFMVGNTVNKYCPYFNEMGLTHVEKQKQGSIDLYTYGESDLTVAVEYCAESTNTKGVSKYFAFNNPHLQMIHTGVWEFANYPHAPEKITNDKIIYRAFVKFDSNVLAINIVSSTDVYLYIAPQTKDIPKDVFVFVEQPEPNPYSITNITTSTHKVPLLIWDLIKREKVFYTDNNTGEIFNNWIKFIIRKPIYKM